ncbi:hypothetical protein MHLNE_00750 [Moorella humiferrea]|uniref:hypothetical protein n=1 Tax=Neomoorella humiferrea TaxID=676965 RepID=UPI0030CD4140
MPFTAPSVANKGNLFRIGPRIDIQVVVGELVTFTILQDTLMLIPARELQPVRPGQLLVPGWPGWQEGARQTFPYRVELIAAKRVLASTWRADDNLLAVPYIPTGPASGTPVKIIACKVKNIEKCGRLFPITPGHQATAVACYSYEVEVVYADRAGRTFTLILQSGPRRQWAVVYPASGYLEVNVTIQCLGSRIISPVVPPPGPPPPYKPPRLWLKSRL